MTSTAGNPAEEQQEAARAAALNELSWELDDPRALERAAFRRGLLWTLLTLPTWLLLTGGLLTAACLAGAAWWLLK